MFWQYFRRERDTANGVISSVGIIDAMVEVGGSGPFGPEDGVGGLATAQETGVCLGRGRSLVVVCRDASPGSVPVSSALVSGILSAGADVIDAGVMPVPAACLVYGDRADLVASVGCPEDWDEPARIEIHDSDGAPLGAEEKAALFSSPAEEVPFGSVGTLRRATGAADAYVGKMLAAGASAGGYVIVDCGGGATSVCAPRLLSEAGADVVSVNAHACGREPPRPPTVEKQQTTSLSDFVNASMGSIGVAYNGDGTRLALLDENGRFVSGGLMLALLLAYMEPRVAVVPFDSPAVVEDAFSKGFGLRPGSSGRKEGQRRLVRVRGDIDSVIEAIRANGADFGGTLDGTFVFPSESLCPDAIRASVELSQLAGGRSIRNMVASLPAYRSSEKRVRCEVSDEVFSRRFIAALSGYDMKELVIGEGAWKVMMGEGQYIVSRVPGDSRMKVVAEAADQVYLVTLMDQATEIVEACSGPELARPSSRRRTPCRCGPCVRSSRRPASCGGRRAGTL